MSRQGRPRLHTHLSRESIARTGLEIVDRDGLEALSFRALAEALEVGTMTLYAHTPDRETLERDIVALLLGEVDTAAISGETWEDSTRRVTLSLREMTLRHPRAFPLIASAPVFEPPVLEYAARIHDLHRSQGIDQEQFAQIWSVVDAFVTGFMGMMSQAALHSRRQDSAVAQAATSGRADLAAAFVDMLSEEVFLRDLEVVLAGLRTTTIADPGEDASGARRPPDSAEGDHILRAVT